jgi:periplasmic protein TonB
MFDSVLGRGVGAPGRPGVGAAVSLSLHALVFAVALLTVAPPKSPLTVTPLRWPTLPRGASTRPSSGAESTPLKPHRPDAVRPRTAEARPPVAPETRATGPDVPSAGPADSPGSPLGEGDSATPSDSPGGREGSPGNVLVLGPEMVPPRLLLGPEPRYPQAALLRQLGGTVVVRCTVTDQGSVQDCQVVKSVPLLDEAALQAVQGRHYAPALYEGRPVSVWMYLPVRFVSPSP